MPEVNAKSATVSELLANIRAEGYTAFSARLSEHLGQPVSRETVRQWVVRQAFPKSRKGRAAEDFLRSAQGEPPPLTLLGVARPSAPSASEGDLKDMDLNGVNFEKRVAEARLLRARAAQEERKNSIEQSRVIPRDIVISSTVQFMDSLRQPLHEAIEDLDQRLGAAAAPMTRLIEHVIERQTAAVQRFGASLDAGTLDAGTLDAWTLDTGTLDARRQDVAQ